MIYRFIFIPGGDRRISRPHQQYVPPFRLDLQKASKVYTSRDVQQVFLDESSQWHVRWVDVDNVNASRHEEVFEFVIVASGSLEKRKFY